MNKQPTIDELRAALTSIDRVSSESWLEGLEERKRRELDFHDRDRDRNAVAQMDGDTYEKFYGNLKYYDATARSKNYVQNWIAKEARGKVFLDYACGNGGNAISAAKAGAAIAIGIDISPVSIRNARADAAAAGVSQNTAFVQADAEQTRLPDSSVDVVICSGMLHHLDLSFAFPELRRILAPGGKILAVEALDYNPAIKLYRWLTPAMRTDWEKRHILSHKDLRFARRFFSVESVRYWHVLSVLGAHLRPLLPTFNAVDDLLTRVPLVRLMSWMFTFELHSLKDKVD